MAKDAHIPELSVQESTELIKSIVAWKRSWQEGLIRKIKVRR
jgi:hypothetical protein